MIDDMLVCVIIIFTFILITTSNSVLQCHGETITQFRTSSSNLQRVMLSILLGSITGLCFALLCACLLRFIFRYMNRPPVLKGPVVFSPQISPKSLQSAPHVLISSNSRYYKVVLDNGFTVAVKTFDVGSQSQSKRRIQTELERLAGLRHSHLMSLRAYVAEEAATFRLVYDYVPTGSLQDAMMNMENQLQLQLRWDARLRIAIGIIKGLQYLHFTCNPRILHYNLKPSNVLLDADFEPRLGDCGLAKLMGHTTTTTTSLDDGIRSSSYYAPECFPNFSIYTEKSDIFSFGVILGILLTGRDPSDPLTSGRGGMGMWFRQLVEAGDGREALDKSLLGEETEEDEMLMVVRIAAVCLSDMPADRPSSDELVPMLTQLHSF